MTPRKASFVQPYDLETAHIPVEDSDTVSRELLRN